MGICALGGFKLAKVGGGVHEQRCRGRLGQRLCRSVIRLEGRIPPREWLARLELLSRATILKGIKDVSERSVCDYLMLQVGI